MILNNYMITLKDYGAVDIRFIYIYIYIYIYIFSIFLLRIYPVPNFLIVDEVIYFYSWGKVPILGPIYDHFPMTIKNHQRFQEPVFFVIVMGPLPHHLLGEGVVLGFNNICLFQIIGLNVSCIQCEILSINQTSFMREIGRLT